MRLVPSDERLANANLHKIQLGRKLQYWLMETLDDVS